MSNILLESNILNIRENGKMTFKQLKELFNHASTFILEKIENNKGKEMYITFSVNEGRLFVSKNKSGIKTDKLKINEYIKLCDDMKEEIMSSLQDLETNISKLDHDTQKNLFGQDANKFFKIKVYQHPQDCINYNTKNISISKDDQQQVEAPDGLLISEISKDVNSLQTFLTEWENNLKSEKYSAQATSIRKINELYNKHYLNLANNKINNCLSSANQYIKNNKFNLNDDSTIDDYTLARIYILLNTILDRSGTGQYSPVIKMNIAKRLLGIKGISHIDINNALDEKQKKYIKENILNNQSKKELLETTTKPLENIIIEYSTNILNSVGSLLSLKETPENKRNIKQINNSIKFINAGGGLSALRTELKRLRFIDKHLNKENYSYFYEGYVYKPSNNFSPINELLKFFNRFEENKQNINIINENILHDIIYEIIKKRGIKYSLLSKKHKKNENSMSGGSVQVAAIKKYDELES